MLPEIQYLSPTTVDEALNMLYENKNARILAGGTDLLIELKKLPINENVTLIDISKINELKYIEDEGDFISIGPLITHQELSRNEFIKKWFPFLSTACSSIGSPQIRSRGTIGGNICNGSPAADTPPVLVALDATVTLKNKDGERELLVSDFIIAPYKTERKPSELLTKIRLRKLIPGYGFSFIKLGRRNALAISRMNIAVAMLVKEGVIEDVRIACGSVFPTTMRVPAAENFLAGKKPSIELFKDVGEIVSNEMVRISGYRWSTPYKKPVISAMVKNSLVEAVGRRVI